MRVAPRNVINVYNFCNKIFRGFRSTGGQSPRFPIDFAGHRYNSAVLPRSLWLILCEIVLNFCRISSSSEMHLTSCCPKYVVLVCSCCLFGAVLLVHIAELTWCSLSAAVIVIVFITDFCSVCNCVTEDQLNTGSMLQWFNWAYKVSAIALKHTCLLRSICWTSR